jgi:hypothetical protein
MSESRSEQSEPAPLLSRPAYKEEGRHFQMVRGKNKDTQANSPSSSPV